jgi:hypothetical protein
VQQQLVAHLAQLQQVKKATVSAAQSFSGEVTIQTMSGQ